MILFDGYCNLCNGFVQFVIKRDPKAKFRFAPLSSDYARDSINVAGIDPETIVLVDNGRIYTKSTAALKIATGLNGAYQLLGIFRIIPRFIRDAIYDWIARHRYRWFGKQESCMVPTEANKNRFLE